MSVGRLLVPVVAYLTAVVAFVASGWRVNDLIWAFVAGTYCFIVLQLAAFSLMIGWATATSAQSGSSRTGWRRLLRIPASLVMGIALALFAGFGLGLPVIALFVFIDLPLATHFPVADLPGIDRLHADWDAISRLAFAAERYWPIVASTLVSHGRSLIGFRHSRTNGGGFDIVSALAYAIAVFALTAAVVVTLVVLRLYLEGVVSLTTQLYFACIVMAASFIPLDSLVAAWRHRHPRY